MKGQTNSNQTRPFTPASVPIDGLPISTVGPDEVLAELVRAIAAQETGHYICITNTESMYLGQSDPEHAEYIRSADFALCDGIGVMLAGLAWGRHLHRLTGPELMLIAARHGQQHGWRHYFYGGKEGVAEELRRRLTEQFPNLIVCGTYCPPFREITEEEDAALSAKIAAAKPDIVWVGLGLPKQERWIGAHLRRIGVPWMIGVGAAFDYHSGTTAWAPKFVRSAGLEWLHTWLREPRRRTRRYLRSLAFVSATSLKGLLTGKFLGRSATSTAGPVETSDPTD